MGIEAILDSESDAEREIEKFINLNFIQIS